MAVCNLQYDSLRPYSLYTYAMKLRQLLECSDITHNLLISRSFRKDASIEVTSISNIFIILFILLFAVGANILRIED